MQCISSSSSSSSMQTSQATTNTNLSKCKAHNCKMANMRNLVKCNKCTIVKCNDTHIVAIFYPFSQFCEIDISLLSLQQTAKHSPKSISEEGRLWQVFIFNRWTSELPTSLFSIPPVTFWQTWHLVGRPLLSFYYCY